jgi:hypothetical protein
MRNGNRFDRRVFLRGAAGAVLAVPAMRSLWPGRAAAQAITPPKRLIVVVNDHGRTIGGISMGDTTSDPMLGDLWSPGNKTGPLPSNATASTPNTLPPSTLLAPLAPIVNEIVTFDGIDNIVRQASTDAQNHSCGHWPASDTFLTCQLPSADGQTLTAPSVDFVAGQYLRANASMKESWVVYADETDINGDANGYFTATQGSGAWIANGSYPGGNPAEAITSLFANYGSSGPPPPPSFQQTLIQRRRSILDAVLPEFTSLRSRLNSEDQATLDAHAQFIQSLEASMGADGGTQAAASCSPPNPNTVPNYQTGNWGSSGTDNLTCPIAINAVVQAIACDTARSFGFDFENNDGPTWDFIHFPGANPFLTNNWHNYIHGHAGVQSPTDPLVLTYQWRASMFTQLVQSLANTQDVDGSRLLDNTLVVWVSPLGYGTHTCFNIPVIMAGLKSAFPKGQGRHVVCARNSLGDLWTEALSMLGVPGYGFGAGQMPYGITGTLGNYPAAASTSNGPYNAATGYPGYINAGTPLHSGPLDI